MNFPNQPTDAELSGTPTPEYYTDLGRAHDDLLRCKDCQKLVTFQVISKIGMCDGCGNKRFVEITLLTEKEMAEIEAGVIDFDGRKQFLAGFKPVEV